MLRLDVRRFASLPSTMDAASAAASAGAPEGLVIVAGEQTAGRGRRGRTWSSPPGAGLYLSFVLRPPAADMPAHVLALLTLAAGVGARRAIARASGLMPALKWPNDVMVGRRKLAGLLAEGIAIGSPAQIVILGLGLNVSPAAHPDDVLTRATSLEAELGRPIDGETLLDAVLSEVPSAYERLRRGDAEGILTEWRSASPSAVGSRVEWDGPAGVLRGVTAGLDTDGALLVRTDAGLERVIAGELRWT